MKTALSALVALFLCVPAFAEMDSNMAPRMHVEPGDGGCIAIIYVHNWAGHYFNTEELETNVGQVRVKYETVGGHNPDSPDIVTVVDLPSGVTATPMHMDLPDDQVGQICLEIFLGT